MENKEDLENGYYWISFDDETSVIAEKLDYDWFLTGIGYRINPKEFQVLGKVSNKIEEI